MEETLSTDSPVNLECREVNGTFWVLGGIPDEWIKRLVTHIGSFQLGLSLWTEHPPALHLRKDIPHSNVSLNALDWVSISLLWNLLTADLCAETKQNKKNLFPD